MKKIKILSAIIATTVLSLTAVSAYAQSGLMRLGFDPISKKTIYACEPTNQAGEAFFTVKLYKDRSVCQYGPNGGGTPIYKGAYQPLLRDPVGVPQYWFSNDPFNFCGKDSNPNATPLNCKFFG